MARPLPRRDPRVALPRHTPIVEEFAQHMAADAKRLVEDEETGEQSYRYVRTGADHFSLAFTYDLLAASRDWVSVACGEGGDGRLIVDMQF